MGALVSRTGSLEVVTLLQRVNLTYTMEPARPMARMAHWDFGNMEFGMPEHALKPNSDNTMAAREQDAPKGSRNGCRSGSTANGNPHGCRTTFVQKKLAKLTENAQRMNKRTNNLARWGTTVPVIHNGRKIQSLGYLKGQGT